MRCENGSCANAATHTVRWADGQAWDACQEHVGAFVFSEVSPCTVRAVVTVNV